MRQHRQAHALLGIELIQYFGGQPAALGTEQEGVAGLVAGGVKRLAALGGQGEYAEWDF